MSYCKSLLSLNRFAPKVVSTVLSMKPKASECLSFTKSELNHAERLHFRFGAPVNTAVNCAGIGVAIKTTGSRGPHSLDEFTRYCPYIFRTSKS